MKIPQAHPEWLMVHAEQDPAATISMPPANSPQRQDIWTQFHDLGHPTSFLAPYDGALLEFWSTHFARLPGDRTTSVLDIGTGNLPIPRILLGMEGIDVEIHAIDTARIRPSRIPQAPNLEFRRAPCERTGFDDATFDLVTGCYALEYTDTRKSLRELNRVMKNGAAGLFLLHHPDSISVAAARADNQQDIPIILKSGIFQATARYVRNPGKSGRRAVERILHDFQSRPELRQFWRIGVVINSVAQLLQAPDPAAFDKWERSFRLDQKRREALIAASVEDEEAVRAMFRNSGIEIDGLGVLEQPDTRATGADGKPLQAGILGWSLETHKRAPAD